ncbi:MAG: hypothetical protein K6E79_00430 [Pseudobutyrivibrio sp.]|nr:hypothetical protein [Pseudobutyrivibrio sp.]
MKALKQVFSFTCMSVLSLAIILATSMQANAGYGYRVTFALGGSGEENASLSNALSVLSIETSTATASLSEDGSLLKIDNLQPGDSISFNPKSAVEVGNEKYYVKGLRKSGDNDVVTNSAFTVEEDQSYVIAYGVGETIEYTVKYQDENGNALLDDDFFYGMLGDEVYVPYRYVEGYVPNAYNLHTNSLAADTVFTFVYKKDAAATGTVTTNYIDGGTRYEYGTAVGDPQYTYQTISRPTNDTGVVNNRVDGGNAGEGNQDAAAENAGGADNEETTITDDQTPAGSEEVVEIDDEDVAKGGEERDTFIRNMMVSIIISIIAIIATLVTVYKTVKDNVDSK